MNKNEIMKKDDVIKMLREMQQKTADCRGMIAGTVSQAWVIKDLLGTAIEELGGEGTEIITASEK